MSSSHHIYFVHDRTVGAIKIGTSINPESRMKALQSDSAGELVPLRYVRVEDGYQIEHLLHIKFSEIRIRGEWFEATPELLDFARHGEMPTPEEVGLPDTPPVKPLPQEGRFKLSKLAEETGVTARTLRYYIAQGVLHGPWSRGRRATYDQTHIDRVREIKALQERGLSLGEISHSPASYMPQTEPVKRVEYPVHEHVRVIVKGEVSPWRKRQIERAIYELEQHLANDTTEEE